MKKLILFTVIFLIFLSTAAAQETDWIYKVKDAEFDVKVSSYFYRGRDVNDVSADLTLYPQETFRESILEEYSEPETDIPYYFRWMNPRDMKITFFVDAKVKTENTIKKISRKVDFPLTETFDEYTHSTETVDSNDPQIIALATKLAAGEDDQYIIVHKLAGWVEENIEYSLDTVTEKASKKASWVMENRRGVCDELTNLFIALARSLDIPARFISGTAYTNVGEFREGWGPHGWAEVYYPDFGWVPYDITYRQFAWLDLSHVTLKQAADSTESSVKYTWAGSDIDAGPIDINVKVRKHSEYEPDRIELHTKILNKQTGFGSHNLIEATVRNKQDYYQTVELRLARSDTLELLDKEHKMVMLKPKESKTVYWRIKVRDDLNPDFKYTSFIKIKSFEEEKQIEFSSIKNDRLYSKDEIEGSIKNIEESEEMIYSHDIDISCEIESDAFYMYESKEVLCEVKNIGRKEHTNLKFCFEDDCSLINLALGQKYSKRFDFKAEKPGEQDLKFTVKNPEVFNVAIIPLSVYSAPELNIDNTYPQTAEYDDTVVLNFSISEKTSEVKDVKVKVYLRDKILQEEFIENLTIQRFILRIPAKYLRKGENPFKIEMTYKDYNDKSYKAEENFNIDLVNVTFLQNIKLYFMRLVS
ncbi:MAG: transglutaminase domain-containing protein [Nanoarchaeota archaeon]|nr:transglutaminase domain-containing protein [Nanoarchaeota archaeon]